jgi:hypothetical protein
MLARTVGVSLIWLIILFFFIFYIGDWVVPWPDVYLRLMWVFLLTGLAAFLKVKWVPKGWTKKALELFNLLLIGGTGGVLLLVAAAGVYSAFFRGYEVGTSASYAVVAALLVVLGVWMVTWAATQRHATADAGLVHGAG